MRNQKHSFHPVKQRGNNMKYKKKIITLGIIATAIISIFCIFPSVNADSGFDSSYDGGGSSGGSSWSGGGSSSYSSSGGGSGGSIILNIIIYAIIIIWIKNSRNKTARSLNHTREMNIDKIKEILPNFNAQEFLQARYQDYKDIQEAWMNFDYDKLRTKVTDELYNQYEMQLQTLSVKGEQNIMSDFVYHDAMVTNVTKENNQITVTIELKVSFYDYIVKNKNIVRGTKTRKIQMHYELIYVCNNTQQNICPNCGAPLEKTASQTCPYCGSTIAAVSENWVLSKKEAKKQR